jgi:hypothetical protein
MQAIRPRFDKIRENLEKSVEVVSPKTKKKRIRRKNNNFIGGFK